MPEQAEKLDIKGIYYFDSEGKKVLKLDYYKDFKDIEFPIFPKGRQIPCAPFGCLKLPKHGGN